MVQKGKMRQESFPDSADSADSAKSTESMAHRGARAGFSRPYEGERKHMDEPEKEPPEERVGPFVPAVEKNIFYESVNLREPSRRKTRRVY